MHCVCLCERVCTRVCVCVGANPYHMTHITPFKLWSDPGQTHVDWACVNRLLQLVDAVNPLAHDARAAPLLLNRERLGAHVCAVAAACAVADLCGWLSKEADGGRGPTLPWPQGFRVKPKP